MRNPPFPTLITAESELFYPRKAASWWQFGDKDGARTFRLAQERLSSIACVEYPDKDGEWLSQNARLVNAALIAKAHAVEWTPALLQTPALQYAVRAEWYGTLGEIYFRAFGHPLRKEFLSGIPNSPQEHHAAPYAITEEFTAV